VEQGLRNIAAQRPRIGGCLECEAIGAVWPANKYEYRSSLFTR
jgi:hypothetical protein